MKAEEKILAIQVVNEFMKRIIKCADANGKITKKDVLSCKFDLVAVALDPTLAEAMISILECINEFFRRIEVAIIRDEKTCVTVDLANEYYYLFLDDMAKSECTEAKETENKEGAEE